MKNLLPVRTGLIAAVLLVVACVAGAQEQVPNIGYVYPAGGRQGDSFEVTVGGQFLKGVSQVYFSGKGVKAQVVKHIMPIPKKKLNDLRQKLNMLQKALPASDRRKPYKFKMIAIAPKFNAYAKEIGLKEMDLKTYFELMKKLKDPKAQPNAQLAEKVILRIKISSDAEPGPRQMRFNTALGLSNPRMFQVAEFKEYRETEPNDKTADTAITGSLPVVINGQIMPGDVDRFEFTARKGTRLVAAADARELIPYLADAVPGWFQAVVSLYNAKGERVAYADDYRFCPDPVLRYLVPETGKYVLEIKDSIYRGREDFVYRITLGATPFVDSIFPLGGRVGAKTTLLVQGWNLPAQRVRISNKDEEPGVKTISVGRGRRASNRVPFALDTLVECRDIEPNNSGSSPQKIKLPTIVNGRINRPGDWDVFAFTGKKGDEIVARVQARSLGSPMDSLLKLTDAAGKTLAVNDDYEDKSAGLITHHADSMVSMKLPANGTYLLHIGDTQNKGGIDCGYRLRVGPRQPDFALRVTPSGISARMGAIVPITVYALRKDGFTDSISLKLIDPPSGLTLSGTRIPAGQDKLTLTMTMPYSKQALEAMKLNLVGQSVINGKTVTRRAEPAEDMMQAFLYRHLVTTEDWMVIPSKRGRWSPPWKVINPGVIRIAPGQTSKIRFTGYKGSPGLKIQLELSNAPAGLSIGKLERGALGARVFELKADASKAKSGVRGNLIVSAFTMRSPKSKDGKKRPPRRMSMGVLPAIPFEITGGK
jgi:hypothetical protein